MSFIKTAMSDAREDELCPNGEYDLEVISAKEGLSKNSGKPMISLVLGIQDPPDDIVLAAPVFHYLPLPIDADVAGELNMEEDDNDTQVRKLRDIRRFLVAFGIPFKSDGFEADDLVGAIGKGLRVEQDDSPMGVQHRLILERTTDEAAAKLMEGGGGGGRGRKRGKA